MDRITGTIKSKYESILRKITDSYNYLNDLTRQNMILLDANIAVGKKVLEVCKSQTIERTVSNFGYNKNGQNASSGRLEKVMPAISLNNKI